MGIALIALAEPKRHCVCSVDGIVTLFSDG